MSRAAWAVPALAAAMAAQFGARAGAAEPQAPEPRPPQSAAGELKGPELKAPDPKGLLQQGFDPAHTRFSFELRTRWGQKISGDFPRYDGEVTTLADGRHQVRIRLATAAVTVSDSERYARMARGERFFNAARYPYIEFLSEPHPADLARTGGPLRGRLTLHGVSRIETFILAPSTCAKPGEDCDGIAHGSVSRDDYRLDGWQLALGDRVRFTMQVRLQSTQSKPSPPKATPSRSPEPIPAKVPAR